MGKPSLLVVDDDDTIRGILVALGEELGFAVRSAVDGRDGLAKVDQAVPDIVVTDLNMPVMDGRGLLERLRAAPATCDTPVVVVTADHRRQTRIELMEAGADDFVSKPVDAEEFRSRLRMLARRANVIDRLAVVTAERDENARELARRNAELERLNLGLVIALERANSFNDQDTGNHIRRVCAYAGLLARAAGCEPEQAEHIQRYAGLHDVGKVGIRDAILKKPGRLTDGERAEMQNHTLIGAELLRESGLPRIASNIALYHHERYDGAGYPHGLGGESIPLEARIVAVVDVFDALVSERCYKPALSDETAWRELRKAAASGHLDPWLVERFASLGEQVIEIRDRYRDEVLPLVAWS